LYNFNLAKSWNATPGTFLQAFSKMETFL